MPLPAIVAGAVSVTVPGVVTVTVGGLVVTPAGVAFGVGLPVAAVAYLLAPESKKKAVRDGISDGVRRVQRLFGKDDRELV